MKWLWMLILSSLVCLGETNPPLNVRAKPLIAPDTALIERIDAIRSARHGIFLATFEFGDDWIGNISAYEFYLKAQQGIPVYLVVDSFGGKKELWKIGGPLTELAKHPNVHLTEFNALVNPLGRMESIFHRLINPFLSDELPVNPLSKNTRMHDKLLLVDPGFPETETAILGGRNVTDEYFSKGSESFNDIEVRLVVSPSSSSIFGSELLEHFRALYMHPSNKDRDAIFGSVSNQWIQRWQYAEARDLAPGTSLGSRLYQLQFLPKQGYDDVVATFIHERQNLDRRAGFLVNWDPDANEANPNSIHRRIIDIVREASQGVEIVSPYVSLSTNEVYEIYRWLKASPSRRFTLMTNSLFSTDEIKAQAVIDCLLGPDIERYLLNSDVANQVEFWEYGNPASPKYAHEAKHLHAKGFQSDGVVSAYMSSNLSPRSDINSESGFVFYGRATAQAMDAKIQDLKLSSVRYRSPEWYSMLSQVPGSRRFDEQLECNKLVVAPWLRDQR